MMRTPNDPSSTRLPLTDASSLMSESSERSISAVALVIKRTGVIQCSVSHG